MRTLDAARHLLRRLNDRYLLRSFGLDRLDVRLRAHLGRGPGFFIEAGANDGLTQSNTLFLERYRGWRGLLVEPLAELAARCRSNRPACIVEHAALVPFDHVGDSVVMRACDLMSVVKGGLGSEREELEHVTLGGEIQGIEVRDVVCPARTLTSLLDRHAIREIDLLSLDVEGYELEVLRGLDLTRHRPRWMLIEARLRAPIEALLLAQGYRPVADLSHHDVLYRDERILMIPPRSAPR